MNDDDDKTVLRSAHRPIPRTETGGARPYPAEHQGGNALPPGTHLGEFEIQGLIGEGGFGIVYLAVDHSLDRQVALKEYMPAGLAQRADDLSVAVRSAHYAETFTMGLKSFVGEARMLARFDSPSLVKVYRFWEENGTAYMVMPFYEGITLKQAIKDRLVEPDEPWIRALLANLLDAIDTIHREQCYHRDIAPDNILLLKDGRPLLLDFGAARRVIGDMTQGLTVILKPGFAPIEQYADIPGLRQGPWTDMYALGAVVYYLITGKPPIAAVGRPLNDDLVPARLAGQGRYSVDLLDAVDKMLAVRPEHRVQSAAELRALLRLEEGTRTMPQSTGTAAAIANAAATPGTHAAKGPGTGSEEPDWRKTMSADPRELPPPKRRRGVGLALAGIVLAAGVGAAVVYQQWGQNNATITTTVEDATQEPDVSGLSGASPPSPPTVGAAPNADIEVQTPPVAQPPAVAAAPATPPAPTTPAAPAAPQVAAVPPPVAPAAPAVQAERRATPAPDAPVRSREDEMWLAASGQDTRAAYEAYLKQYPRGKHAGAARVMLDAMAPRKAAPPTAIAQSTGPSTNSAELGKTPPAAPPAPPPATPAVAAPASPPAIARAEATAPDNPGSKAEGASSGASGTTSGAASGTASNPSASAASGASGAEPSSPLALAAPPAEAARTTRREAGPDPEADKPADAAEPKRSPAPQTGTATQGGGASAQPGGAQRTIRYADQTMVGDFTPDPATGIVSGTGRITWTNGDRFEGRLNRGVKEGKGTFVWANGQRYSGEWSADRPNGKGVLQFADGSRYEGTVRDGIPHGQGTTRFKNGDVYSGNWVNGVLTGQARLAWSNGNRYEGEVHNSEPHGKGTSRFRSGDSYTGEWVKGRHHGQGRYTWASGSYWEGEFRDGQQTANGDLVRASPPTASAPDNAGSQEASGQ